jgi:hypothetical protein
MVHGTNFDRNFTRIKILGKTACISSSKCEKFSLKIPLEFSSIRRTSYTGMVVDGKTAGVGLTERPSRGVPEWVYEAPKWALKNPVKRI